MSMSDFLRFPDAFQAQIIRAHQRDVLQVASLRRDTDDALRAWFGTRWLSRWEKELDLLVRVLYFGLTTGLASQTIGEEYTDIWARQVSSRKSLSPKLRTILVILPAFASYALTRSWTLLTRHLPTPIGRLPLPSILDFLAELNLAIFYLKGSYYHISRRVVGVRYISSLPPNPNSRPPSYALLGLLILIRLAHKLYKAVRTISPVEVDHAAGSSTTQSTSNQLTKNIYIDTTPITSILEKYHEHQQGRDDSEPNDATRDQHTYLDIASLSQEVREARRCALCLEERMAPTLTECGHIFCWTCIVPWTSERGECPLCRQAVEINKLLPIYNL